MFSRFFTRSSTSVPSQAQQTAREPQVAQESFDLQCHELPARSPTPAVLLELPSHLRDVVISAPLQPNVLDAARHIRLVVAQDPFSQAVRLPLFDSHPTHESKRTSRKAAVGSYSSCELSEVGSYASSISTGSLPSQSLFSGPSPDSPSFYRLVEYMFGSMPMAYKSTGVKMRQLAETDSSDRRSFLITKLFSVSTHEAPSPAYSADSVVPEGAPPYPHLHVDSSATSLKLGSLAMTSDEPAPEHEWVPTSAPGNSLPVPGGKGLCFAIGVIISLPRDQQSLLTSNWDAFSKALDEFSRVVYVQLQNIVLAQRAHMQCPTSGLPIQAQAQLIRVAPGCLLTNEDVRMSALRFCNRFTSGISIPRVRTGISKWDVWREEARRLDDLLVSEEEVIGSSFLENVVASFLGAHTDWLETFGFVNPLLGTSRSTDLPVRTVVVGDKQTAQRVLFLLAAFLPDTNSCAPASTLRSSLMSSGPQTVVRVNKDAWDIPGWRQPPRSSGQHHNPISSGVSSCATTYISSIWSEPLTARTPLTPSAMGDVVAQSTSSGSSISGSISLSCSSSTAELDNDADFFGPWEDISGSSPVAVAATNGPGFLSYASMTGSNAAKSSHDIKPRYSVAKSNPAVMEVSIPARYADLRFPSLSACRRSSWKVKFDFAALQSGVPDEPETKSVNAGYDSFHPEFQIQSCSDDIDTLENEVLRALVEDADYGHVVLPAAEESHEWTVVSRALIVDVDKKDVQVWSVLRKLSNDGRTCSQRVTKNAAASRDSKTEISRMWTEEDVEWSSPGLDSSASLDSRERVERVLMEVVAAARDGGDVVTELGCMMVGSRSF